MELLRHQINNDVFDMQTKVFGSFEEAMKITNKLNFPLVYKQAAGAMGKVLV